MCTNTKAYKQVNYHKSICLSCKICWVLLSQNIWSNEVHDDLSVCVNECSPCGLSITGDIKICQCLVSKGNDLTTPDGEVPYQLLSKELLLLPKFNNSSPSITQAKEIFHMIMS